MKLYYYLASNATTMNKLTSAPCIPQPYQLPPNLIIICLIQWQSVQRASSAFDLLCMRMLNQQNA